MGTFQQCASQTCAMRANCPAHAQRPESGQTDLSGGQVHPIDCLYFVEAVKAAAATIKPFGEGP